MIYAVCQNDVHTATSKRRVKAQGKYQPHPMFSEKMSITQPMTCYKTLYETLLSGLKTNR